MASGATKIEALLSQLNVARTKVARSSGGGGGNGNGDGGGSSGEGGSGSSNPLAAGTAATVIIVAPLIDRVASCPVSSWGQRPPSAPGSAELQQQQHQSGSLPKSGGANAYTSFSATESTLEQVQPRIPSDASVDGANMYGAFEDAAPSPTPSDTGEARAAVLVAPPPCGGSVGGSNVVAAHLSPFAAVAEQRQKQGHADWGAAHEALKAQRGADAAQDTAHNRPSLSDSEPNDSAIVRHGNLGAKDQGSAAEGLAADARHVC